jgi:viologen exporter family transport system permease protein
MPRTGGRGNAPIWWAFASASIREQMDYRRSFMLEIVGKAAVTGLELAALLFLFARIDAIGGWSKWEVVYLYGLASMALGAAELLTSGLDRTPEMVRTGAIDGLLVRPLSPLVQMLCREIKLFELGRGLQGLVAMAIAMRHLPGSAEPGALALLVVSLVSTVAIYSGLFLAAAASCFWTVQSGEAFNAFTYGGVQMTQYPISVYPRWLRDLFLYAIPIGFTTYVPAFDALGKAGGPLTALTGGHAAWLAPAVAALFLFLCWRFWRLGVDRYQGTGS